MMSDEEIVRSFFERSIAILDKGLVSIFKKYPLLSSADEHDDSIDIKQ